MRPLSIYDNSLQKEGISMNILVIGSGLLGRKTAELLDASGHTVSVLDENADNLALLSPEFSGMTSMGFPMDIQSLRSAGVEGCDAAAVVTADDNLNITVGQLVKDFFHVPRVVARISDPHRETVFEGFGLQTVCPTNMAGDKLAAALTDPQKSRQVTLGLSTLALTMRPVDKKLLGRTTAALPAVPGEGVLGVMKESGRFLLLEWGGELPLEAGDSIVYSRQID